MRSSAETTISRFEPSDEGAKDLAFLADAIAVAGAGKDGELEGWRAKIRDGRMDKLGIKRRMYVRTLMHKARAALTPEPTFETPVHDLPKLPPGMTDKTPRHGFDVRHRGA